MSVATATRGPAPVAGHGPVTAALARLRLDGRLAHATLLTGPDGVGKTTVAEQLAAELLDSGSWPGGPRAHPDLWLEDSAAERIALARIRFGGGDDESGQSLQDFLSRAPYAGGARVAVIGRADRLTEQAANALLKTLEEPPPSAYLILCAAHPERMPATVLSRCQSVALAPVPSGEVLAWLRGHGVEPGLATTVAALCGGRPGRALTLATAPGMLAAELDAVEALLAAGGPRGRRTALELAGRLAPPNTAEGRERAIAIVTAWTAFLRDVAVISAGAPELVLWEPYRAAATRWAEVLPPERVDRLLGRCTGTIDQLAQYAVPRLCLEVLLLDLLGDDPPPPRVIPPARPVGLPPADRPTSPTTPRRRPPTRRR